MTVYGQIMRFHKEIIVKSKPLHLTKAFHARPSLGSDAVSVSESLLYCASRMCSEYSICLFVFHPVLSPERNTEGPLC